MQARAKELAASCRGSPPLEQYPSSLNIDSQGVDTMSIKRYGVEGGKGTGGQQLPFARAVEADGWLYVSGQVPMVNGEVVEGNIITQAHQAIRNLLAILKEAGYTAADVVRCGVWLDDARDFQSFNKVFREYFGENPPARACVQSSMVVDCKVEIDCVAYKKPDGK
jgi:reactive intermediate/imine deaminase